MPTDKNLSPHLPLTESTFFILLSLLNQSKHGYAIMKDVQSLSENRVALSTGTLYGAIKRLLDLDWIIRVEEIINAGEQEGENGRNRKAYALTRLGKRILDAEINRLQSLVSLAQSKTVGGQA